MGSFYDAKHASFPVTPLKLHKVTMISRNGVKAKA